MLDSGLYAAVSIITAGATACMVAAYIYLQAPAAGGRDTVDMGQYAAHRAASRWDSHTRRPPTSNSLQAQLEHASRRSGL
ncbi:hypothetical protein U9M48_000957 [Paspalum notatum var. saurae]|uniref:Uncharacterized protein n=1 Tax=Paspalum notatum var. saurae TaxID=547442 RepID=A0AAQ3PHL6_PASNO